MMNLIIDGGSCDCDTPEPKKNLWVKHFAWKPIKIHGSYYWLTTVYKRVVEVKWPRISKFGTTDTTLYIPGRTEYGTIFDVLKEE